MLTTDYIYRHWTLEDIFGDGIMFCPVCGQSRFVKLEPGGGVWCEECNANFVIRHTAGDPGVVVDCFTEHVRGYFLPEGAYFWQVLKDCFGGLDDRIWWCARVNGKLDFTLTRDKAVGVKKFQCKQCWKYYSEVDMSTVDWNDGFFIHRGICKSCQEQKAGR